MEQLVNSFVSGGLVRALYRTPRGFRSRVYKQEQGRKALTLVAQSVRDLPRRVANALRMNVR